MGLLYLKSPIKWRTQLQPVVPENVDEVDSVGASALEIADVVVDADAEGDVEGDVVVVARTETKNGCP